MNCVEEIAASIGLKCESPIIGGYTGRAIFIPENIPAGYLKIVTAAGSPNLVHIGNDKIPEGEKPLVLIDNALITSPFEGSNTAGSDDDGYRGFAKTLILRVPERGGLVSKNIIEPLLRGVGGMLILEKRDKADDGAFELVGYYNPMRVVDPTTVTKSETENGGAWNLTLQTTEFYGEVAFVDDPSEPNYSETLSCFEDLILLCKSI